MHKDSSTICWDKAGEEWCEVAQLFWELEE